jgi:hypothetical protein
MNNKLVIIIQGPSNNVEELKKAWDGYNLIWSTWKGSESRYSDNDIVIFNDVPHEEGVGNIKLQQLTTNKGIEKAKELGYQRVFKWRSDMIPTNPKKLITLLTEGVNILFFHNQLPYRPSSYVDYVMESDIDTMVSIWDFDESNSTHAEAIITSNINRKNIININLFGGCLNDDNDIVWLKRNIHIKDYKHHKLFEHNLCNDEN